MTSSRAVVLALAVILSVSPASASKPDHYALKMMANPLVARDPDPVGLPPVICGGFVLASQPQPQTLDPTDTLTLELALVPFHVGPTTVQVYGDNLCTPLRLIFRDGLVNGMPYDASGWNDVHVDLRVATQDYDLTINGVRGGPFPFATAGGSCTVVSGFGLSGDFLDQDIGWLDSVSLTRNSSAGPAGVAFSQFDTCFSFPIYTGGGLVVEPPKRLRTK